MDETIEIAERGGIAMAAIMARKGVTAAAVGKRLGLTPPLEPRAATDGALTLIATGPGAWLAIAETGAGDWVDGLRATLAGAASVSEQTAGYTVLRMRGPGAEGLLQKGAFIDLDPTVFGAGAAAVTVIAHIGVILWKVDDAPTFDVALFRSLTCSFRDWIAAHLADPRAQHA